MIYERQMRELMRDQIKAHIKRTNDRQKQRSNESTIVQKKHMKDNNATTVQESWVLVSEPKVLCDGDTMFLNTFASLLFRFHSGAHSYLLVLLLRNLALAVVPVIPDVASAKYASAAVVFASVLLGLSMSP